jgi:hypothetical protein
MAVRMHESSIMLAIIAIAYFFSMFSVIFIYFLSQLVVFNIFFL